MSSSRHRWKRRGKLRRLVPGIIFLAALIAVVGREEVNAALPPDLSGGNEAVRCANETAARAAQLDTYLDDLDSAVQQTQAGRLVEERRKEERLRSEHEVSNDEVMRSLVLRRRFGCAYQYDTHSYCAMPVPTVPSKPILCDLDFFFVLSFSAQAVFILSQPPSGQAVVTGIDSRCIVPPHPPAPVLSFVFMAHTCSIVGFISIFPLTARRFSSNIFTVSGYYCTAVLGIFTGVRFLTAWWSRGSAN